MVERQRKQGVAAVTTGSSVEIDGVTYGIYNDFSDALVPDGCSRTTMDYNGETVNAILQDVSGKYFVYLTEEDKDPVMALYNEKEKFICDYRNGVYHRFQLYLFVGDK